MVILGLLLIVMGWLLPIPLLVTLGIIVLVIGLILALLGVSGHPVAGRRYYW